MMLLIHNELGSLCSPRTLSHHLPSNLTDLKPQVHSTWPLASDWQVKRKKGKLNICSTIPTPPKNQSKEGQDGQPGVKCVAENYLLTSYPRYNQWHASLF